MNMLCLHEIKFMSRIIYSINIRGHKGVWSQRAVWKADSRRH